MSIPYPYYSHYNSIKDEKDLRSEEEKRAERKFLSEPVGKRPTAPRPEAPSPFNQGDRLLIEGSFYSRIFLSISGGVSIEYVQKSYDSILKKIAVLVISEIFYPSKVSILVFQYFASALIKAFKNSQYQHQAWGGRGYRHEFNLEICSRNPCMLTTSIPLLNIENKKRGFSIPGSISSSGFINYHFTSKCHEITLDDFPTAANNGWQFLEDQEGKLVGKKHSLKSIEVGQFMDHFELPVYLTELKLMAKSPISYNVQTLPKGWLTSPPRKSLQNSPETNKMLELVKFKLRKNNNSGKK